MDFPDTVGVAWDNEDFILEGLNLYPLPTNTCWVVPDKTFHICHCSGPRIRYSNYNDQLLFYLGPPYWCNKVFHLKHCSIAITELLSKVLSLYTVCGLNTFFMTLVTPDHIMSYNVCLGRHSKGFEFPRLAAHTVHTTHQNAFLRHNSYLLCMYFHVHLFYGTLSTSASSTY